MRLFIDNMDGNGSTEYTAALTAEFPLEIKRTLNEPTLCTGGLCVVPAGLEPPVRTARVLIGTESEQELFSGYIINEPFSLSPGEQSEGETEVLRFTAASDEWLLDQQSASSAAISLNTNTAVLLQALTKAQGITQVDASSSSATSTTGVYVADARGTYSENAGRAAAEGYTAYRVADGTLTLTAIGATTHALAETPGALSLNALTLSQLKDLANDVAVSGEIEPTTYVTEVFNGDGTTNDFTLSDAPFTPTGKDLVSDSFTGGSFNTATWTVTDPASHLSISAAGLTVSGGTGVDGATALTLNNAVELGGTLLLEADQVIINPGSSGVLCGLYAGTTQVANCVAGIRVRPSGSATIAIPLLNGAETGTAFNLQSGHIYSFRLRLHSPEIVRVAQTYSATVAGTLTSFGGGTTPSDVQFVCDVQDLGLASSTAATVLCDATIGSAPAVCTFALVNSLAFTGSIGSLAATRTGTAWVISRASDGTQTTRLVGTAGQGVDCKLTTTGKLTFFAGRTPVAGEKVLVSYRTSQRSFARKQDAVAIAAAESNGLPGLARWQGHVLSPATRSSADCESAAAALVALATDRSSAISGSCSITNAQQTADIWPGDVLQIAQPDGAKNAIVRTVTLTDGNAAPEQIACTIKFANDWAESVSMKLSNTFASDVPQPVAVATAANAPISNLSAITVVAVAGLTLQLDMGINPPTGGGFEVRLAESGFGSPAGVVLRSTTRGFTMPRAAQVEHYYIRMYDGSLPPRYSRFSAGVFTNVPMT